MQGTSIRALTPRSALLLAALLMIVATSAAVLVNFNNGKHASAAAPLSTITGLHVSGNTLLNGNNQNVRLLGVNRSGTEYKCVNNASIFDGPSDAASVDAMASWKINAVRVPLNEDCWLGINGVQDAYTGANYRQAIVDYVNLLNSKGLIAIPDLHWNAPGTTKAFSQQPMPDADHAYDFWRSVANTFKNNSAVIFNLYNEPHYDAGACWKNGSSAPRTAPCESLDFAAAGMQSLINTIRNDTGATNVIMVDGWGYANYIGGVTDTNFKLSDSQNNLIISAHVYANSGCNTVSCYSSQYGAVAQTYPVVLGELGENDCAHGFIDAAMDWADQNGVGYLGWAWTVNSCTDFPSLIDNYDGTPNQFGIGFKNRFAALASSNPTPTPAPGTLNRSSWQLSSSTSSYCCNDALANAIDGNLNTRWSSDAFQTNGQYFQIDLGSAQSFNKIVLDATNSVNDYPQGYQVFASNDSSNFGNAIASGDGGSATSNGITTITFSTQNARYIRVVQTGSSSSYWWSIAEVNVYAASSGGGSGGTATLNPTADRDNYTGNAGGADTIHASLYQTMYLKFDLSSVGSNVTSAKLRVYRYDTVSGSVTLTTYQVSNNSWSEADVNSLPSVGSSITTASSSGVGYVEFDITNFVSTQRSGGVVTIAIAGSSSSWINFNSRENANNKPQLVVTSN